MTDDEIRKWFHRLGINGAHRSRDWVNAMCPFAPWKHKGGTDNRPGFGMTIVPNGRSTYHCLACKSTGGLPELIADLGRLRRQDYSELVKEAALTDTTRQFSWEEPVYEEETLTVLDENAFGTLYPNAWGNRRGRAYLESRGVGERAVRDLGLGYDPEDHRIVCPVRDRDGLLYGFTGRSVLTPEEFPHRGYNRMKDYFGLPKKALLLGEQLARPGRPFFVVEGLFGLFCAIERGVHEFCNPVALMGSAMTAEKAHRLEEWGERVFLAVDPDDAGDTCLWGTKDVDDDGVVVGFKGGGAVDKLYNRVPIYLPAYPEGKVDPDQLTADDVRDMIKLTKEHIEPPKRLDKTSVKK